MNPHSAPASPDPELPMGDESAEELVRGVHARLLPNEAFSAELAGAMRYARQVADGLVFAYALDQPTTVRMLTDKDVQRAGIEALSEAACANLQRVPVQHEEVPIKGRAVVQSVYGDSPFVASKALFLPELIRQIGADPLPDAGALVAVPTRHLLAYHPIADSSVAEAINGLAAYALGAYEDGPGSLSPRLYWWHDRRLTCLTVIDEDTRTFSVQPPPELLARLKGIVRLDEDGRIVGRKAAGERPDIERMTRAAGEAIARLSQEPATLADVFTQTLALAHARCAPDGDPRADRVETWDAWATSVQLGSALFAGAQPQTCAMGEELERPLPAFAADPPADARAWLDAVYLAIVCREIGRIEQLCRVPIDALRRDDSVDAYVLHWIETLQRYFLPECSMDDVVEKLGATMESSYGAAVTRAPTDFVNAIDYHPVELFHRLIRRDHEKFAGALRTALAEHADYWGESTAPRAQVALGVLAMASMAYGQEFPVEAQQPFLPQYLLDGSRIEVFPSGT